MNSVTHDFYVSRGENAELWAENPAIIAVEELQIGYANRVVLKNLNFQVRRGEIFAIMGGSGCGKSTLLKHMIGLYEPQKGVILINGNNIHTPNPVARREMMKSFGVTYQGGALLGSLTLAENVALPLEEHTQFSAKEISHRVRQCLSMVNLDGFEHFLPAELSGGMKKRAGLARALALNPELLFFDEPSAGLDPISSAELDKLMLKLRDEDHKTIVIITHELDSVFSTADRIVMLDRESKTIVAEGNPHDLRDHAELPWVRQFLNRDGMR